MLLENKTAVVTGAANGNGRGIALSFAEHGASVVVADIREEALFHDVPTHELINSETEGEATFLECDATKEEDVETAVDLADEYGGIDVMVNNVGTYVNEGEYTFEEIPYAEVQNVIDANLKTAILGCQIAGRKMAAEGGGSIINISSVSGIRGEAEAPVYSGTKGGVALLSYGLASYFGESGVRVNALHPGLIHTPSASDDEGRLLPELEKKFVPQTPLGRAGEPKEVGDAAVFLASDLASYVTGSSLVVDGGFTNTARNG